MLCVTHAGTKPNIEIVLPVRVKTPQTPTFCFAREFCTAEAKSPAPPARAIACNVWAMASFGSYAGSSMTFGLYTCSSVNDITWPSGDCCLFVRFKWEVSRLAQFDRLSISSFIHNIRYGYGDTGVCIHTEVMWHVWYCMPSTLTR